MSQSIAGYASLFVLPPPPLPSSVKLNLLRLSLFSESATHTSKNYSSSQSLTSALTPPYPNTVDKEMCGSLWGMWSYLTMAHTCVCVRANAQIALAAFHTSRQAGLGSKVRFSLGFRSQHTMMSTQFPLWQKKIYTNLSLSFLQINFTPTVCWQSNVSTLSLVLNQKGNWDELKINSLTQVLIIVFTHASKICIRQENGSLDILEGAVYLELSKN